MAEHRIVVFGKEGCPKCKTLNSRIDALIKNSRWDDVDKEYVDVSTVEGLVRFSRAECINPQRIPALVVTQKDPDGGTFNPVPNPRPDEKDEVCGDSRLYSILGLQTDYSSAGRGVISKEMITSVLAEATSA